MACTRAVVNFAAVEGKTDQVIAVVVAVVLVFVEVCLADRNLVALGLVVLLGLVDFAVLVVVLVHLLDRCMSSLQFFSLGYMSCAVLIYLPDRRQVLLHIHFSDRPLRSPPHPAQ